MRVRFIVTGLVQGIGFRSFTVRHARDLGLKGYVRNVSTDKVEIVVEGYEPQIKQLHEVVKQGPIGARVENVEIIQENPKNEFDDFEVRF